MMSRKRLGRGLRRVLRKILDMFARELARKLWVTTFHVS